MKLDLLVGRGAFVVFLLSDDVIQIFSALNLMGPTRTEGHWHHMLQSLLTGTANKLKWAPSARSAICVLVIDVYNDQKPLSNDRLEFDSIFSSQVVAACQFWHYDAQQYLNGQQCNGGFETELRQTADRNWLTTSDFPVPHTYLTCETTILSKWRNSGIFLKRPQWRIQFIHAFVEWDFEWVEYDMLLYAGLGTNIRLAPTYHSQAYKYI